MRERIIQEILDKKIISIVRGVEPDKMVRIAEALYQGGVTMIEVTFNQKNPDSWQETADSIAAIKAAMGEPATSSPPTPIPTSSPGRESWVLSPCPGPIPPPKPSRPTTPAPISSSCSPAWAMPPPT